MPKLFPLVLKKKEKKWDNKGIWSGNYMIDSSQPSSWVRHCGYFDFMAKTSENRLKWLKNNQHEQKIQIKNNKDTLFHHHHHHHHHYHHCHHHHHHHSSATTKIEVITLHKQSLLLIWKMSNSLPKSHVSTPLVKAEILVKITNNIENHLDQS